MAPRKPRRTNLETTRKSHFDALFGHDTMPSDEDMLLAEPISSMEATLSVEAKQDEMEQEQSTSESNA